MHEYTMLIIDLNNTHCMQFTFTNSDLPRPPTVKADELKSMEMGDEDEGGWAGHHEEVDYTKEVVFSDSSDDETQPPTDSKGKRKQVSIF